MNHEWKFGQWGRVQPAGLVVRYVGLDNPIGAHGLFIHQSECTSKLQLERVEYLPDCTGFDWHPPQPIDPGEGYRIIDKAVDTWQEGDEWYDKGDWVASNNHATGTYAKVLTYRRKLPPPKPIEPPIEYVTQVIEDMASEFRKAKYRAFKSGSEFQPYRDLFFCSGADKSFRSKVIQYNDRGVFIHGIEELQTWSYMFYVAEFEDETPFGVLDADS